MKKDVTLALETGIYGGSFCLLRNGNEIASWIGESVQTKSHEYLEAIKEVLCDHHVHIGEINKIIISEGPGSYTGLRIGFSIAKGLKMALGIEMVGISILDEMAKIMRPITIAAFSFGKDKICWKVVGNKKDNKIGLQDTINLSHNMDFVQDIKLKKFDNLILPQNLYGELLENTRLLNDEINIFFCDRNFARIIGMANQNLINEEQMKIIYPKTIGVK